MYLATNTRPDIAYPLNQICRCMANPTPELMRELDRILVYLLHYNQTIGLTYVLRCKADPADRFKRCFVGDAVFDLRLADSLARRCPLVGIEEAELCRPLLVRVGDNRAV